MRAPDDYYVNHKVMSKLIEVELVSFGELNSAEHVAKQMGYQIVDMIRAFSVRFKEVTGKDLAFTIMYAQNQRR
jgi:hypothetical protein